MVLATGPIALPAGLEWTRAGRQSDLPPAWRPDSSVVFFLKPLVLQWGMAFHSKSR